MFTYTFSKNDSVWVPGPYEGVELCFLKKNEVTGGAVVLRKFKNGTLVPAHRHPNSAESVYILEGDWDESGTVYKPGTFFHVDKNVVHGPHLALTDVLSLTTFDGPFSVVPA